MSDSEDLRRRIERLEQMVEAIAAKVGVVAPEEPSAPQPPPFRAPLPPAPPPPSAEPFVWPQAQVTPEPDETIGPQPRTERLSKEETEFVIGRRYLPVAGAVVVILGLMFLAQQALARGWINLQTQFVGEILLCLLFCAIGVKKLNEKENFGSILVAVGLSGLYLSLSGAFFFKALLTGEAYIGGFVAVSLASHAFSYWRSSKPFMFLGLFGGLSAALMAWGRSDAVLNMVLHGVAMAPAWVLTARKKWAAEGIVVWIVTTPLTLPALSALDRPERWALLAGFWAYALIGGHVVMQADEEGKLVTKELPVVGLLVTAVAPVAATATFVEGHAALVSGWRGYVAVMVYALAALMSCRVRLSPGQSRRLAVAASVVAALVPPLFLTSFEATVVYAVSATGLALVARRWATALLGTFAVLTATASYAAYILWSTQVNQPYAQFELPLIGFLIAMTLIVSGLSAPKGKESLWHVVGSVVVWLLLLQGVGLALLRRGLPLNVALAWGTVVFIAGVSLVAALGRRKDLSGLSGVAVTLGVLQTCSAFLSPTVLGHAVQVPLCLGMVAAGLFSLRAAVSSVPDRSEALTTAYSLVLGIPFARLVWLLLDMGGADSASGALTSVAASASVVALVAWWKRWVVVSWAAAALFALCAPIYAAMAAPTEFGLEGFAANHVAERWGVLALLVSVVLIGRSFIVSQRDRLEVVLAVASLPAGLLACRLAFLVFAWPPFALNNVVVIHMTFVAWALATAGLAGARSWRILTAFGCAYLVFALALYPCMKVPELGFMDPPDRLITRGQNLVSIVALLAASLLCHRACLRSGMQTSTAQHLFSPLNWSLVTGLFVHTLDLPPLSLAFDASVSIGWTFYAALTLAIGFRFSQPVLRYWALGVFGAAIVKVVVYDLAFMDPVIKIFVLIVLGVVMIGGGYVYIRSQATKPTEDGQD